MTLKDHKEFVLYAIETNWATNFITCSNVNFLKKLEDYIYRVFIVNMLIPCNSKHL